MLIVLMQEGRASHDRTARGVATALERETVDVSGVLRRLERDDLVAKTSDRSGQDSWIATI